ncbi:MAG: hypothetical protein MZV64_06020 [Ignavibacteriales bacterium]|nr:hypothetical protein [Ignavibacteriales bacterium]
MQEMDFNLKDQDAPRYYVETGDAELITYQGYSTWQLGLEGYVTYNQKTVNNLILQHRGF